MQSPSDHVCGINKFIERDVDMFMAEELRVNPEFGRWILGHFKVADRVVFPATSSNVSVVEDSSEADVVATFNTLSGSRHRLFVENKIDAMLMPEQLERYVRRAEGEVRRGLIESYSVLFFTPSAYLQSRIPEGVVQISFEAATAALRAQSLGLRSEYKASLLEKALPLRTPSARDAQVALTDPYIKNWWDAVYVMLETEFPGFFHHKTRYPRSVYFAPENPGQAPYLRVDFKGHKGEVDLAFKNVPFDALSTLVRELSPPPGQLVPNRNSSAIQVSGLAPFVISDGFDIIQTKVRAAYQAAYDLLSYWRAHRDAFDRLVNGLTAASPAAV
jgi:hypothetical protein